VPGAQAGGERVGVAVSAQLDRVVDRGRILLVTQLQPAVRRRDERSHAEIDIRRQPAVELDLGSSGGTTVTEPWFPRGWRLRISTGKVRGGLRWRLTRDARTVES
jgi:hypothetical protein